MLSDLMGEEDPALALFEDFHALAPSSPNSASGTACCSTSGSSRN